MNLSPAGSQPQRFSFFKWWVYATFNEYAEQDIKGEGWRGGRNEETKKRQKEKNTREEKGKDEEGEEEIEGRRRKRKRGNKEPREMKLFI